MCPPSSSESINAFNPHKHLETGNTKPPPLYREGNLVLREKTRLWFSWDVLGLGLEPLPVRGAGPRPLVLSDVWTRCHPLECDVGSRIQDGPQGGAAVTRAEPGLPDRENPLALFL